MRTSALPKGNVAFTVTYTSVHTYEVTAKDEVEAQNIVDTLAWQLKPVSETDGYEVTRKGKR